MASLIPSVDIQHKTIFDIPPSFVDQEFEETECDEGNRVVLTSKETNTSVIVWKRLLKPKKVKESIELSNRYLYMHEEDRPYAPPPVSTIQKLLSLQKWVIFMCHGGYFAGAVFHELRIIDHKTFHAYVVRKKQGGRQSTRDKSGRRPKSGGAQIRRHNEDKHERNIRDLMQKWQQHLQSADIIFLGLPGRNKDAFLRANSSKSSQSDDEEHELVIEDGEVYLDKSDDRIRTIPFTTKRPNLGEVKRVFKELSSITLAIPKPGFAPPSVSELTTSLNESGEWNVDEIKEREHVKLQVDESGEDDADHCGSGSDQDSPAGSEEDADDDEENGDDDD